MYVVGLPAEVDGQSLIGRDAIRQRPRSEFYSVGGSARRDGGHRAEAEGTWHSRLPVLKVLNSQPAAHDSAWITPTRRAGWPFSRRYIPSWFLSTAKCPPTMFKSQFLCITDKYG